MRFCALDSHSEIGVGLGPLTPSVQGFCVQGAPWIPNPTLMHYVHQGPKLQRGEGPSGSLRNLWVLRGSWVLGGKGGMGPGGEWGGAKGPILNPGCLKGVQPMEPVGPHVPPAQCQTKK